MDDTSVRSHVWRLAVRAGRALGFTLASRNSALLLLLLVLPGCKTVDPETEAQTIDPRELTKVLEPSNHRNWKPHMAVLPYSEIRGDRLKVYNIRNFKYVTEDEYILDYYNRSYDLGELKGVDFILVPFDNTPSLAHTMLSFGFNNGDYLAVSVEVRLEEGETYSPIKGAMRNYEIMYVVADERDLIQLRTHHRQSDVFVYRAKADRTQTRVLLVDIMNRVNKLRDEPEFYDTFSNNCTTNIVRHINNLRPGRVPYDWRILLPGYSDRMAYDLGLLDTELSFEETRARARVNDLAELYRNRQDFSTLIRR